MKKATVAVAAITSVILIGVGMSQAQPPGFYGSYGQPGYGYQPPMPVPGFGPQFGGPPPFAFDYADMLEDRFDWMEDRLDITDDQKEAFNAFRDKVLSVMDARKEMRKSLRKDRPKDPLEMDQRRIAMLQQRVAAMKEIAAARKDLFAVLTEDQREEATDLMMRHGYRTNRGGMGWYWGY